MTDGYLILNSLILSFIVFYTTKTFSKCKPKFETMCCISYVHFKNTFENFVETC